MRHPFACSDSIESTREFRFLRRLLLRAIVVCCVLGLAAGAPAQDEPKPETPGAETPEPGSITPARGDIFWLEGPDGKPVPVPYDVTPKQFRELILGLRAPAKKPPASFIGNLAVTGEVEDDLERARLDLVIDVSVQENRSVRVPLRLSEGTLLKQEYSGEGSVSFEPPVRTGELVCWFSGAKVHELALTLSVPIRKTPAGYRILLSLPESVVSSLDLTIPRGEIQVRPAAAGTRHETTSVDNKKFRLRAYRLGTAIDLTWQEVPGQNVAKAELQTQTLIEAHLEADDVRLEVTQTVASQGSFQEIFVRIPAAFSVSTVTDENFPKLNWEMAGNGRVRVDPGAVTSLLELRWVLTTNATSPEAGSAADERPVLINALTVEDAARQDGLLGLTVADGFSVEVSGARSVRRLGISSFRRLAGARLRDTSQSFRYAWQFDHTAFQISLKRTRIVPSFVVRPRYTLSLGENEKPEAVLTAVFDLQVFRGKLDRIDLLWPNFQAEGWGEPVITEPQTGAEVVLPGTGEQADKVTLLLENSISRSEAQSIELRCSRPISLDQFPVDGEETFALTLPMPIAQRQAGFGVTVQNGGSIECSLEPGDGTTVTLIPNRSSETSSPQNTRDVTWQVGSGQLQFAAQVQSFDQTTSCETKVTATISDDTCLVEQTFDYEVLYRRLNEVRLLVPANRAPQFWLVNPQDPERRPLAPELTGVEVDDRVQFRLDLEGDLWGQFQIIAQYEIPFGAAEARPERLTVPLMASSDATSSRTHLEVQSPDNVRVVPEESAGWEPELTVSRRPGWVAQDERQTVPLSLEFSQERAEQNFTIRQAAIETRFLPTPRSQAAYLIDGDVSFLTIHFPISVDLSRQIIAWWDGEKLTAEQFRPVAENPHEFQIDTRDLPSGEQHVLAVEFDSKAETTFGALNALRQAAPRFAPDVWLAETHWNIVLPVGQHLSVYPDDYSPRFAWQRQTIVWDRSPVPGQSPIGRWLVADLKTADGTEPRRLVPFDWFRATEVGNSYRFSSFGGRHEIHFQTMSQPAIVFTGAGFALAIGFILLRIPTTRHVLTFLGLGFVMAAVALWKPEPVQLLIQPAVFGLLLAIVAAVLENRIRRSQQASLVTLSSPGDFLAESDEEVPLHVEPPVPVEQPVEVEQLVQEEPVEDGSAA